ncbi:MAG: glycosyltransferase family 39 protein, partial [Candidatus Margulisiibacteriota bacterium]
MGLDRPNNFRNKYFFLFLMILILGIAVRFYNPTFRSLWGDEAHSFYLSQQIAPQTIVSVTSELIQESHLPVYFVLLSAWTKIFGISEYVLRLLSILIGVCGLMVFFGFARRLFDNKTALISLLLLALSPLAVMHSQEIRMYGLLFLFSTLSSSYFWLLLSKKRTVWSGIGYVFCSLLLLLTHIYGALIIIAQFLYLLFELWREEDKLLLVRPFLLQMFTCLLVIPFYARMLWLNLFAVVVGATDMAFSVFPWYLKFLLLFFVLSLGETVAPWDWLVVLPAGVILGCLLLRNLREFSDNRIRYLLFLCFVPILLAAMFLKPTMPKYLIICLPFYLLLVGHAIVQIKGQVLKYGLVLIIMIADLFSLNNYYNLHDYHNSNQ